LDEVGGSPNKCVELEILSIWYDTVDQPVIPINIANNCDEVATIYIEIVDSKDHKLYSESIKLEKRSRKHIEITIPYYGEAVIRGYYRLGSKDIQYSIGEYRVKL